MITKDILLRPSKQVAETIDVPVWGKTFLRNLSFGEVSKFNSLNQTPNDALAFLVVSGVCDEEGNRVFGDDDLEAVKALPAEIVFPVIESVSKRIGVTFEAIEAAKKN